MRRTNLVVLLEKMHDCQAYLERHFHHSMKGELPSITDRDPQGELDAIADLLFPELNEQVFAFSDAYRERLLAQANLGLELATHPMGTENRQNAYDAFRTGLNPIQAKLFRAADALKAAARLLMLRMDVDEGPAQSDER